MSAVIIFVRLATGRLRAGLRRQRTLPVSTSKRIPAFGGCANARCTGGRPLFGRRPNGRLGDTGAVGGDAGGLARAGAFATPSLAGHRPGSA